MSIKIPFLSRNEEKIRSARMIAAKYEIEVEPLEHAIPEIQAADPAIIAAFAAKAAAEKLGRAVAREDDGFFIGALNGFPGAYISWVEKTLTPEQILKLMEGVEDRSATWHTALAWCEPGKMPEVFQSFTHGVISKELSGEKGHFTDLFFIPNGSLLTLAHYEFEERMSFYDRRFLEEFFQRRVEEVERDNDRSTGHENLKT